MPRSRPWFNGTEWAYAGMDGGCIPVGAPGQGWYDAIWEIDPSFDEPTADTRELHLLVRETYVDCAVDVPVIGRLSPAWVFLEQDQVRIHLFSRHPDAGRAMHRRRFDAGHGHAA